VGGILPSAFRRSPALPRGFRDYTLLPSGIVGGEQAAAAVVSGNGWPLAGGTLAFTTGAVIWREDGTHWLAAAPFAELVAWAEGEGAESVLTAIHRIGAHRPNWGGLALDRPLVMGIVNTTPDSFSDGGLRLDPEVAVVAALALVEAGADIIDVGGESTRPGSDPVPEDEELARVLPVVATLAQAGVIVSVDTRRAGVMRQAVAAGARVINDVAALREAGALEAAASGRADVCLMHMVGEPKSMQDDPRYECAPLEVYAFLAERVAAAEAAGIPRSRIAIDPGIGFGKNAEHNAQILGCLALYHGLGCPLLLGVSRKRFVAAMSRGEPADQRLAGSLAAAQIGLDAGVQILRVHDVAETAQAVRVWRAIRQQF